ADGQPGVYDSQTGQIYSYDAAMQMNAEGTNVSDGPDPSQAPTLAPILVTPTADEVNQANSFLANAGTGVGTVDEFGQSPSQPNTFNLWNAVSNIVNSNQSIGTKLLQGWDLANYEVPNADSLAAGQMAAWQNAENPNPELTGLESMNSISTGLYGVMSASGVSDQNAYAVAQLTNATAPLLGGLWVGASLNSQSDGGVPVTTGLDSTSQLTQVQINAQNGAAFQARVANYGSDTLNNFLEEVSIQPFTDADGNLADFRVRLDGIGTDPDTSNFGLLEAKSSETAPLTTNQSEGYPLLGSYGGQVVGKAGNPYYPAGTVIPPTQVQIIRPSNLPEGY
ncbi:hypothetical protein, partial [Dyella jejuensis]